jgi:hypothetical protein
VVALSLRNCVKAVVFRSWTSASFALVDGLVGTNRERPTLLGWETA